VSDDFPNAYNLYKHEISLPIYPKMDDRDVEDVITAVKKIINYYEV
jgi:dTDP-4-amino-4,6-dideoxygalactose transaminase